MNKRVDKKIMKIIHQLNTYPLASFKKKINLLSNIFFLILRIQNLSSNIKVSKIDFYLVKILFIDDWSLAKFYKI